jgi:hypothetical protein
MESGAKFVCVFEFGGTERTVTSVVQLGAVLRVPLPVTVTWPDGSQSDFVEILVDEFLSDEADCPPSAPVDVGAPQAPVDRPDS